MKHALVLGNTSAVCNELAELLGAHGFLVTPVFNAKKALHIARLVPFELIVTCTTLNPDDRRSLTGELKRSAPDAFILLLADPVSDAPAGARREGVDATLPLPVDRAALRHALGAAGGRRRAPPRLPLPGADRRC